MQNNKVEDLLHYLDDYFTVGPPDSLVCANNIVTMVATYEELGFAVNPEKVTKPATITNFLRVDINSVTMEARIDPTHLSDTISLLKDYLGPLIYHQIDYSIVNRQTSFCVPSLQAW